jgi:tetratricopeptide (TPR) repeat protein
MTPGVGSRPAPRFSIVVIVRNEAQTLPRLLHGLEQFVARGGELVVVDTGSVDCTTTIARARGCRVEAVGDRFEAGLGVLEAAEIQRRIARAGEGPLVTAGQRLFHFGDARQHAGLLAANRFVLQLDASDELLALDVDPLDRWIESGSVAAFEYDQRYGRVGLRISRFYDRRRFHWEGRVHEVLGATPAADGAPASTIRCDAAQLSVRHHKDERKPRHYLAGLALQTMEFPQKPRWWHYLGRELYYHRWYRSAIAVLERHAAMEDAWIVERSQSLCFAGECLEALGCAREAEETYRRALGLDATRREPLLRLAAACCRRGDFDAAARSAREALAVPRTSAYPELDANYTWIPHSILYWSLFWLGRMDEARVHWEACRHLAPEDSRALDHARLFPVGVSPVATTVARGREPS